MKNNDLPALKINELSYDISDKKILDKINITLEKNQFVGLLGPNGTGKTTLLKHIYRVLPPNKNTIFINGQEIEKYTIRESARHVTVMKQENDSDFSYSNLDMVLMGRFAHHRFYENYSSDDLDLALSALDKVGMVDYAKRSFSTLSGGEKQRVLIARSLVQNAEILLLDEPTNHLDIHYQWLIMEKIKNMKKSVFAVFHEFNLACAYCDYLYILNDHKIYAEGTPKEVCTEDMLATIFRIDATVMEHRDGIRVIYNHAIEL